MPTIQALVTPELLVWARKSAHLRPDEAAKKIGVDPERLEQWESGLAKPTIAKARLAAKVYGRPLAVLFLEAPPKDFDAVRDFRRVGSGVSAEYSHALTILIRDMQARQEWAREIRIERGAKKLPFVGASELTSDIKPAAVEIRNSLGVTLNEQFSWPSLNDALNAWVDHAEQAHIFVAQTSCQGQVSIQDARGFALVDPYVPYVFLNAKDSLGGRIFTLAHEIAHLWLGISGVSGADLMGNPESNQGRIERFCNRVASLVVFPESAERRLLESARSEMPRHAQIDLAARQLKVSRDVVAHRLLDKGIIDSQTYQDLHAQYIKDFETHAQSSGGGNYYINHSRAVGKAMVRLVTDAYARGRINGSEAAGLLHAKIGHFTDLLRAAHAGAAE